MPDYKIPIYVGVNDSPVPPNETNNCNADYFIDKYNTFVDYVDVAIGADGSTIIPTATFYLNSSSGSDVNTGTSLGSSVSSITRLKELVIGGTYDLLILDISGSYSVLNFQGINARKIKLISSSGLTFNGSIELFSDLEISMAHAITWVIDSSKIVTLNSYKLEFLTGVLGKLFRTSNSSISFRNGSVIIPTITFDNNTRTSTFILSVNSKIYLTSGGEDIDTSVNFKLLSLDYQSELFLSRTTAGVVSPQTVLVESINGTVYVPSNFSYDSEITKLVSGDYTLSNGNNILQAKEIIKRLSSVSGNDRLNVTAIKNIDFTPAGIKGQLESLSGNDRLDAQYIKNLNSLDFFNTTTASFVQPDVYNQVTISVVDSAFLGEGNYILIKGAGFYRIETIISDTSMIIRNLGYTPNVAPGVTVPSLRVITVSGEKGSSAFTFTTADFSLPAINGDVSILLDSVDTLVVGSTVIVNDVDVFRVLTISGLTITAKRLGIYDAITLPFTVIEGTKVATIGLPGKNGLNSFTTTVLSFTQPALNGTTTINVESSIQFVEDTYLYISDGGYYTIDAIPSVTSITVRNLGGTSNALPTTSIPTSSKVMMVSAPGESSIVYTTSTTTVPTLNSNVTINMTSSYNLAPGILIQIAGATFRVVSTNVNNKTAIATFVYHPENTKVATNVLASNSLVVIIGETGTPGKSSITNHSGFTVPAIDSTVALTVDASDGFIVGQDVFVSNAGYYIVHNIVDYHTMVIRNIGTQGNAITNTTIDEGTISVSGKPTATDVLASTLQQLFFLS